MHILGISCFYHDAAACLLQGNEVVSAVEEERFTRKKHDPSFPINAIEFCLSSAGLVADEVDAVCFYEYPLTNLSRIVEGHIDHYPRSFANFKRFVPRWFGEVLTIERLLEERLHLTAPLYYYPHHLSHGACSFFSSGFDEAALLVVDAAGERCTTIWGKGSGATVALEQEIPYPHSIGMLYFSDHEIENFLRLKEIPHEIHDGEELCATVCDALAEGKVVGWFQGKMEFGPRALGNRSILATPARAEIKEIVNAKVKGREEFRPFGASVLEEEAGRFFVDATTSPFMQKVFAVIPEQKEKIPAVVHRDGTCRIHTVAKGTNDPYRRLLESFQSNTGLPLLLNTSFNTRGEPIVSNPREAYECFANSGLDLLVLGNHVVTEKIAI